MFWEFCDLLNEVMVYFFPFIFSPSWFLIFKVVIFFALFPHSPPLFSDALPPKCVLPPAVNCESAGTTAERNL